MTSLMDDPRHKKGQVDKLLTGLSIKEMTGHEGLTRVERFLDEELGNTNEPTKTEAGEYTKKRDHEEEYESFGNEEMTGLEKSPGGRKTTTTTRRETRPSWERKR